MEKFSLSALGWNNFFESQLKNLQLPGFKTGRIITENRTNYRLISDTGEFIAEITGKLMFAALSDADLPKVGDWVIFTMMDDEKAMIHQVLERKTQLARKAVGKKMIEQIIVTNLDVLFIVQGLDDNFNLSRLERYLAALQGGIEPVIVLNKADQCNDVPGKILEVQNRIPGVPVIATSFITGDISSLRSHISYGKTFAFVGSSGVGKSSLVNTLLDNNFLKTFEVREKDSKGRHTTTRREMVCLETGGILVDTPGMREFQPWSDDADLSIAFHDINAMAESCRYSNCEHIHEDLCAVKEAVASGAIESTHYNNYLKLRKEISYQQSVTDVKSAQERKRSFKESQRAYNKILRNKKD